MYYLDMLSFAIAMIAYIVVKINHTNFAKSEKTTLVTYQKWVVF